MDNRERRSKTFFNLFSFIGWTIFLYIFLEGAILCCLFCVKSLGPMEKGFLEGVFLVILPAPILYFLIIRPLMLHLEEHKQLRQALEETQKAYVEMVRLSPYPTVLHDGEKVLLANKIAAKIYGVDSPEKMIGKKVSSFVHPEFQDIVQKRIQQIMEKRQGVEILEEKFILANGEIFHAEVSGIPVPYGKQLVVHVIFRDITEKKKAEAQIRKSLKEKELLLQEILHRIKNNLQVISCLLNLHKDELEDPKSFPIIEKCQKRIQAFSKIYEQLYISPDLGKFAIQKELPPLLHQFINVFQTGCTSVELVLDLPDITFSMDQTVPLALILSELISNSLKHGIDTQVTSQYFHIYISLKKVNSQWELTYYDDGQGYSSSHWSSQKTLGLPLIQNLAIQLGGSLEVLPEEGGKVILRFLENPEKEFPPKKWELYYGEESSI